MGKHLSARLVCHLFVCSSLLYTSTATCTCKYFSVMISFYITKRNVMRFLFNPSGKKTVFGLNNFHRHEKFQNSELF